MTAAGIREHGTRTCYVNGPDRRYRGRGCRCEPCRAANRAAEHARTIATAPPYVDAAEAREHVRALQAAGVGLKTIARAAGVPHGGLAKLIYGDPARGSAPSQRVRPATAAKLLAVSIDAAADGARVDAARTWQTIATLRARGWTKSAIARAIGQAGPGLQLGRATVTAGNARAIAALLDQPVPPRGTRHGPVAATWNHRDDLADRVRRENEATRRRELRGSTAGGAALRDDLPTVGEIAAFPGAACALPNVEPWIFHAAERDTRAIAAAKTVCATCPASAACLQWALDHDERYGVWGGMTDSERQRRAQRQVAS